MSIALETAIRSRVAVQDEGLDAEDRGDGEAQAVHARRIHVVHPKTIADWYGFRFTWIVPENKKVGDRAVGQGDICLADPGGNAGKSKSKWGGFQATCPFHLRSTGALCRKTLSLRSPSSGRLGTDEGVLNVLKDWCLGCSEHSRQSEHLVRPLDLTAADLSPEVFECRAKMPKGLPDAIPHTLLNDSVRDGIESGMAVEEAVQLYDNGLWSRVEALELDNAELYDYLDIEAQVLKLDMASFLTIANSGSKQDGHKAVPKAPAKKRQRQQPKSRVAKPKAKPHGHRQVRKQTTANNEGDDSSDVPTPATADLQTSESEHNSSSSDNKKRKSSRCSKSSRRSKSSADSKRKSSSGDSSSSSSGSPS